MSSTRDASDPNLHDSTQPDPHLPSPFDLLDEMPINGFLRPFKSNRKNDPKPEEFKTNPLSCPFIVATREEDAHRRSAARTLEKELVQEYENYELSFTDYSISKKLNTQFLEESKDLIKIQTCLFFFIIGDLDSNLVIQLTKDSPHMMNHTDTVRKSSSWQSRCKCQTLDWATEAVWEIVESSGRIEKWKTLTLGERGSIFAALLKEAPAIISDYCLRGVRDRIPLRMIFKHKEKDALQSWRQSAATQIIRIADMVWLHRVSIGVWDTRRDLKSEEKQLSNRWARRTMELGDLDIDLKQVPTFTDNSKGRT